MLWAEEVVWQNLRGYEKKFDEAELNQDSKSKTCEDKKDVCLTSGGLVDDEVQ